MTGGEDSQAEKAGKPAERWRDRLRNFLGLKPAASIRDDLTDALDDQAAMPDFTAQERALLKNVLNFREIRVLDVMVPRADIIAVPADITLGALLGVFRTAGHSRLPVYGDTLDDPRGMVHIRDFLDHLAARGLNRRRRRGKDTPPEAPAEPAETIRIDLNATLSAAKLLRPVLYAPPSMPALDLLVRMQATRTHMALVIDEYGGTDGLVSIEDVVEVIVGDIEDEHDEENAAMIQALAEGGWLADARLDLDEAEQVFGVPLRDAQTAEDIDTIGGLIVLTVGRVPVRGEIISGPGGLEFEVADADPRRVKRVKIHNRAVKPTLPPPTAETAAPAETPPAAGPSGA